MNQNPPGLRRARDFAQHHCFVANTFALLCLIILYSLWLRIFTTLKIKRNVRTDLTFYYSVGSLNQDR